jgi:hypothetical protein
MQQAGTESTQPPTRDIPARTSAAFNKVKQFYGMPPDVRDKFQELERSFVEGTDSWLSEDPTYKKWLDGEIPVLWLAGEAGVGKSHLSYSAIKTMQERAKSQPRTILAYFFFQETNEPFRSARNALCSIGLQIAQQDRKIREALAHILSDQRCSEWSLNNIWNWTFPEPFDEHSDAQLYLVLDGVDEAWGDIFTLLVIFNDISKDKLRIHVLLTGRRNTGIELLQGPPLSMELPEVDATLEKSRRSLRKIVDARLDSLPRLCKFSQHVKEKIAKAMLGSNQGLSAYIVTDSILM